MRSRLSRLLKIASSEELHPTSAAESRGEEEFDVTEASEVESVGHDSELSAHDEAVFLLHTAAEIEHSLMMQYLYAAYSLGGAQVPEDKKTLVNQWKSEITQIAKEEMGHLASVQNLLHLIGGALNIEREDFPFRNELYPFRFKLEPLTKDSLAKYVFAEMPPNLVGADIEEIKRRANQANPGNPVNHVGLLFKALAELFKRKNADGTYALTDFLEDTENLQAGVDWTAGNSGFIIRKIKTRDEAITLIEDIAEQGEGMTKPENMEHSHYQRFRKIYDMFPEAGDWQPSQKLPSNPNTTFTPDPDAKMEADLKQGRIINRKTRLWAQLLNVRYRMLLVDILHSLHLQSDVSPDKENRSMLRNWAFQEMFSLGSSSNLKKISNILITLPQHEAGEFSPAGPPFELPYTLTLPANAPNCWRLHRDMITASQMLTQRILADAEPTAEQTTYLNGLSGRDRDALTKAIERISQTLSNGSGNNPSNPPPVAALSFAADIKGMFRDAPDRSAMLAISQFDLHKFEDVRDLADNILTRLEDGSMPCDGSWSAEQIAKFKKWIDDGKQP